MIELTLICKFWIYIVSSHVQNNFFPTEVFFLFVCLHWGVLKKAKCFIMIFASAILGQIKSPRSLEKKKQMAFWWVYKRCHVLRLVQRKETSHVKKKCKYTTTYMFRDHQDRKGASNSPNISFLVLTIV